MVPGNVKYCLDEGKLKIEVDLEQSLRQSSSGKSDLIGTIYNHPIEGANGVRFTLNVYRPHLVALPSPVVTPPFHSMTEKQIAKTFRQMDKEITLAAMVDGLPQVRDLPAVDSIEMQEGKRSRGRPRKG